MSESNLVRVDRILQKLAQARSRNLECFGSHSHGFRLNVPISESELQAFETSHKIRLPEDYRTFLTHAGNGGAGPYYGIFPLDKWDDFADWFRDGDLPDNFLALPCPLHPKLKLTENWEDSFDESTPYQGTLSLGSQGCSYGMQLIVSGAAVGRVVYVDVDGQKPYICNEPDFLSWYERWLDELLQGYKLDWFGYGIGGDEDKFFLILDDEQADDDLKIEAAHAFRRLPSLSDGAAYRIIEYLDSPISAVRSGILVAIQTFKLGNIETLIRLLDDPSADVRKQAVPAVMSLGSPQGVNAVLQRLREDTDPSVASTAFVQLQDAGVLSRLELLDIIGYSPLGNLRHLAARAVDWTEEDSPLLIRMLSDSHTQVRFYATLGLRELKARNALPQVLELLSSEQDKLVVGSILLMLAEFEDRSTVPILLKWAKDEDDFHRLDAISALAKFGDDRAIPIARAMLQEDRRAERWNGGSGQSSGETISVIVRKYLEESPNQTFQDLAG